MCAAVPHADAEQKRPNTMRDQSSRLHFAPQQAHIHPDDLPEDYEPSEIYRGIGDYVTARRKKRHQDRRSLLRGSLQRSSQDSDNDSDDTSSSSSSTTAAAHVLGFSKLRALFGDSSSSSSESSTSDSESDDGSSVATGTRSTTTDADHVSFVSSGRRWRRPSSSLPRTDTGEPTAVSGTLSALTPRLSAPRRRRRRVRRSEKDIRLLRLTKPSRKARKNARRMREIAGGTTEYVLYAPLGSGDPPVVNSRTWKNIGRRLGDFFQYHAQHDHRDGDMGLPNTADVLPTEVSMGDPALCALDDDEIDLALPSPALSIHAPQARQTDFENEMHTGRHMSDIPLTPFLQPEPASATPKAPFMQHQRSSISYGDTPRHHAVHSIPEEGIESMEQKLPEPMPPLPEPVISPGFEAPHRIPKIPQLPELDATWWLDIHCPTYRVMQHLGLRFPLHPLTVEDILKQEPREKFESFEKLGYSFVVLRAMDTSYFRFTRKVGDESINVDADVALREKSEGQGDDLHIEMVKNSRSKEGLEGVGIGSVNLYLVVFSHGIISFHFEDLSMHINRVQQRLLNNSHPFSVSPYWIMYELYDSIVDAIEPFVSFLEYEMGMIEMVTNDPNLLPNARQRRPPLPGFWTRLYNFLRRRHIEEPEAIPLEEMARTLSQGSYKDEKIGFNSLDAVHQRMVFQRLKRVREIDTGISRLLAPKPDVMRGITKRLEDTTQNEERYSIFLYFDDVYDHIMSMLTLLSERDGVLSHAHMVYLNRIRLSNKFSILMATQNLAWCAGVGSTVMYCTWITGCMSMNLRMPAVSTDLDDNIIEEHDNVYAFGTLIAILSTVPCFVFGFYLFVDRTNKRRSAKLFKSH